MEIRDDLLISRKLKICENCEWCIPVNQLPRCLLNKEQKGLFETCELFKWRTANHITM